MNAYDELFETMDTDRAYMAWLSSLDGFHSDRCEGCWNCSCPGCYDSDAREVCEVFQKELNGQ